MDHNRCVPALLFLVLNFVLSNSCQGTPNVGTKPLLLDNKHAACSACMEIASFIAYALENPSPELLHQGHVQDMVGGKRVHIPYVKSQHYASDLLEAVCNSSVVARLVRKEDWLGLPYYAPDEVPVYARDAHVEESLFSACEKLTHQLLHPARGIPRLTDIVKAHRAQGAPAFICTNIVPDCRWKDTWSGRLFAGAEQAFAHDPSVLLRLAPFVTIGVTVPVLFGLSFIGRGDSQTDTGNDGGTKAVRKGKSRTKRKHT
ncbi:hypothetical protein KFL_003170090 [Klebsormidium nitens]|uniref:DUF3456 domain-containing protein n=1 Tax=Klebsormidium nitens TaxID=105231 RepID=A0A1Y1I7E5_KLENI|nr:hypothetical protein KFL_003170090 [Klebsormidium nitens]|eukprot:GAQ86870.1 hypothetical protein KFL_003170090 [Klebsormidium nitens]